ncbi:MAG: hypothetical protein M3Z04_19905 [Chloroflexota bacterium]|nr:hypothetical protein [Chloroflexota bacterium]
MEHTISTTQVNDPLNGMVQELIAKGDRIVLEQDGEAVAVVVPVSLYTNRNSCGTSFLLLGVLLSQPPIWTPTKQTHWPLKRFKRYDLPSGHDTPVAGVIAGCRRVAPPS